MEYEAEQREHMMTGGYELRQYVGVLIKYWWLIALGTVLAAAAALVASLSMTPTYEATAGVLIAGTRSQITFDPRFQTVDSAGGTSYYAQMNQQARRSALVAMVRNGATADRVAELLKDELDEAERHPARLLGMVSATLTEPEGRASSQSWGSDFIEIKVTSGDPAQAARIANVWAEEYASYVNELYNKQPESYASVQQQAVSAKTTYDQAEDALLAFMTEEDRTAELDQLIAEKEMVISKLQSSRELALSAVINETIDSRLQIISAYQRAQAENRLLAFNKAQEAKRKVLGELIDAEIANRLAALRRDRDVRLKMFNSAVDAEIQSMLAVFERQVNEKLSDLTQAYQRKDKVDRLLRDARSLRTQVAEGGPAGSDQLTLMLLKAEAFASSASLPGELQVQISTDAGAISAAEVDALISALEADLAQAEQEIQTLSESLLAGDDYQFLQALSGANLSSAGPVATSHDGSQLASLAVTPAEAGDLSAFITQKYTELFELGAMAQSATHVLGDTPLFREFQARYPELFELDALMQLATTTGSPSTSLEEEIQQRVEELIQLEGMEGLLKTAVGESAPIAARIAATQREVRQLRVQKEALAAQLKELTRARDQAWSTYSTLLVKVDELRIAIETEDVEVRFASPAVEPLAPTNVRTSTNVSLAAVVGLMLATGVVFLLHYLDPEYDPATLVGAPLARLRGTQPAQQTDV